MKTLMIIALSTISFSAFSATKINLNYDCGGFRSVSITSNDAANAFYPLDGQLVVPGADATTGTKISITSDLQGDVDVVQDEKGKNVRVLMMADKKVIGKIVMIEIGDLKVGKIYDGVVMKMDKVDQELKCKLKKAVGAARLR